jgi:biotin transporter BioY
VSSSTARHRRLAGRVRTGSFWVHLTLTGIGVATSYICEYLYLQICIETTSGDWQMVVIQYLVASNVQTSMIAYVFVFHTNYSSKINSIARN